MPKRTLTLAVVSLGLFFSGCATKQPEWIDSEVEAFCATNLTSECLGAFGQQTYSSSLKELVIERELREHSAATTAHLESTEPATEELPADSEAKNDTDSQANLVEAAVPVETLLVANLALQNPMLAFGLGAIGQTLPDVPGYLVTPDVLSYHSAGTLTLGHEKNLTVRLTEAHQLDSAALRSHTLYLLLISQYKAMSEAEQARALDSLYESDPGLFKLAMVVRLAQLLSLGDYERAAVFRDMILSDSTEQLGHVSLPGAVLAAYAINGLERDAIPAIHRYLSSDGDSDDEVLITQLVGKSFEENYPAPQDFYGMNSQEGQLRGYLTLAFAHALTGNTEVSRRALHDATKFVQRAANTLDKAATVPVLLAYAVHFL